MIVVVKDKYVVGYGNKIIYLSNGYPCIEDKNIYFVKGTVDIFEVDNVPDDIDSRPDYQYTAEKGFYLIESNNPYGLPNELYDEVEQRVVDKIATAVSGETPPEPPKEVTEV